ncbi:PASTA domain-containing protein [Anaerobutyricum hallii]|nr:PASTA domain-containing protein [Anaerobutyricum hallii]
MFSVLEHFCECSSQRKIQQLYSSKSRKKKYVVGNYVGVDLEKAENAAKESELQIVITNRENSDKKEGVILSQDPAAGKEVGENNKNIYVIVSAGNEKVKMPDYVGISSKKCAEIEKADNIRTVTSESKESNIIPEYVVEQSEKAGNKIAKEQRLPCLCRQAGRI